MIEWIKDRWLTFWTKKTKQQRDWEAWVAVNIVYGAGTINNRFMHFKHIIVVDYNKFLDLSQPFGYCPCEDANQYLYPARPLGENAVWCFERVFWNPWQQEWNINGMGDEDKVFVATNNDEDATMIALKYS